MRGAADALVVEREAAGLDDVERHAQAGGKPDEGAEILRDVGLEEGEAHGVSFYCGRPRRESACHRPCGALSQNACRELACDQSEP